MSDSTAPALELRKLGLSFGGLRAVHDVSLALPTGALHGLIGPNGAGKTTIFNLLTGVYRPDVGEIRLGGRTISRPGAGEGTSGELAGALGRLAAGRIRIGLGGRGAGLRPSQIARAGMARTFQNIRLFGELSVLDNVCIAAGTRARAGLWQSLVRTPMAQAEERCIRARSRELLDVLGIGHRAGEQAKSLPYGDQRRLEIARALATEPKVLLLDEPVAGMNSSEKHAMRALIQQLRTDFGVAILLIEHDMGLVMDICEHITVLDHGEVIAAGAPSAIQADPAVIAAYLGVPDDEAEGVS